MKQKSPFLRIGDTVINTHHIHTIKISTDNYRINMMGNPIGQIIFGSGNLGTENNCILVSKQIYSEGYDKVTKWLSDNNLDN
jgi:hypothetical protein